MRRKISFNKLTSYENLRTFLLMCIFKFKCRLDRKEPPNLLYRLCWIEPSDLHNYPKIYSNLTHKSITIQNIKIRFHSENFVQKYFHSVTEQRRQKWMKEALRLYKNSVNFSFPSCLSCLAKWLIIEPQRFFCCLFVFYLFLVRRLLISSFLALRYVYTHGRDEFPSKPLIMFSNSKNFLFSVNFTLQSSLNSVQLSLY